MEQIYKVEDTARKALDIANDIKKMDEQQDRMREEISTTLKADIKEELEITKLQAQMKVTLIELVDLQNCTMRFTLIFKNIPGIQNKSWEDTSRLLADFQISRANWSTEHDKEHPNKVPRGPKPIFAQLVNCCIVEEIRNQIVELNSKCRLSVFVSQMYSKELTLQRNGALKYRRGYLN